MALILPGNSTKNIFRAASNPSLTGVCAYVLKFNYVSVNTFSSLWNSNTGNFGMQFFGTDVVRMSMGSSAGGFSRDATLSGGTGTYTIAVTQDQGAGEIKFYLDGVQQGATEVAGVGSVSTPTMWLEGFTTDGIDWGIEGFGVWTSANFSVSDLLDYVAGTIDFSGFATPPALAWEPVGDGSTYLPSFAASIGTNLQTHQQGPVAVNNFPYGTDLVVGPILTGPSSTTLGAATVGAGTDLDTITTLAVDATVGGFSVEQTSTSAPTATTWPFDFENGIESAAPGSPANGVPFSEVDFAAAGITAYVTQMNATDGVTPTTFTMTTAKATGNSVIQGMIATSNTTDGESIWATSIFTGGMQDDAQAYVPNALNGMNITWNADGTFTTDADQTENFTLYLFSPSNGEWGAVSATITQTTIVLTSGLVRVLVRPLVRTLIH